MGGFWSLLLLEYILNLALVNKSTIILVSIRDWRLLGKIWYNGYHQDTELRRHVFVLHRFGEYLNAIVIGGYGTFRLKHYRVSLNMYLMVRRSNTNIVIYENIKLEL